MLLRAPCVLFGLRLICSYFTIVLPVFGNMWQLASNLSYCYYFVKFAVEDLYFLHFAILCVIVISDYAYLTQGCFVFASFETQEE